MRVALVLFALFLASIFYGQSTGTINIKMRKENQYLGPCYSEYNWFEQDSLSSYTGTVTDTSGMPISCVRVFFFRDQTNFQTELATELYTDSLGVFKLTGIPLGIYRITLGHRSFITGYYYSIDVPINQHVKSNFQLYPFIIYTRRELRRLRRSR